MKPSTEPVIVIKSLTKKFGNITAVDGLSFSVNKGEIFAFLGPNGAGKTTTIKMLITLLAPTEGEGTIDKYNFVHNPSDVRRVIGYVPQMISVDGTLTAYENLRLMASLYDISPKEREECIGNILSFLKLEKEAQSLVKTFSGGMIRKLEIAQAIMHNPLVLFLDEPTTGLDPIAKKEVWEHLLELNSKFKTTIFFSTHNMDEAEEVSTRVAIMDAGRIAATGTVSELKRRTKIKDATLEQVFIFFTGKKIAQKGNFRNIKQARRIEHERR